MHRQRWPVNLASPWFLQPLATFGSPTERIPKSALVLVNCLGSMSAAMLRFNQEIRGKRFHSFSVLFRIIGLCLMFFFEALYKEASMFTRYFT